MVLRHAVLVAVNISTFAFSAQKTYFFVAFKAFIFIKLGSFGLTFVFLCLVLLFLWLLFRNWFGFAMYFSTIDSCLRIASGAHPLIGLRTPKLFTFNTFFRLCLLLLCCFSFLCVHCYIRMLLLIMINAKINKSCVFVICNYNYN